MAYSSISGSMAGVEVGGRHVELVGPPDARGLHVGEVLEGRHHLQPGEIERLPRPVGQLLLGIDLRAAFGQYRLERAQGLVVGGEGGGLFLRCRLGGGGGHDARAIAAGTNQGQGERCDEQAKGER